MKFWLILIGVYLFSCSSDVSYPESEIIKSENIDSNTKLTEKDSSENNALTEEEKLIVDYNLLTEWITTDISKEKRKTSIDYLFHKDFGFFVIYSNGALPSIKKMYGEYDFHFKKPLKVFQQDNIPNLDFLNIEPIFESLPKVICDEEIYDKQGCFFQEINPLLESQIWNYAGLNEKEIQAIEFLAETVEITVVNTFYGVFHFSKIEGKWYLTFIDIRIPCQA